MVEKEKYKSKGRSMSLMVEKEKYKSKGRSMSAMVEKSTWKERNKYKIGEKIQMKVI